MLLASVESKCLDVVKILCENFESEFVEAFRFCEGLKLPCVEKGAKIIYPNMAKEFIAYLDTKGFFTNQKCFILTDKVKDKDRLLYLTAILNSKTNFWYFKHIGATLGASGYEMSKIFVERLPIVETHKIDSTLLGEIESLVREILDLYAESRPLRGAEIVDKGGSSASARLELEAETSEALPLIAEKAASFSRVKGSGEGLNPFLREKDKRNNNKIYNLQSRLDSLIYQIYDLSNDEINLIESEFADKEREREQK